MTDILASTVCDVSDVNLDAGGNRVRPLISIFVEETLQSDEFFPVGCCITAATPPPKQRDSIVDETCINVQEDCLTAPTGTLTCNSIPNTQPGPMQESTLQFTSNYVPGSALTEFFEQAVSCGTKYRWIACYANRQRQKFTCGWVSAYVPQDFSADAPSAQAQVTVTLCGDWSWEASGTAPT